MVFPCPHCGKPISDKPIVAASGWIGSGDFTRTSGMNLKKDCAEPFCYKFSRRAKSRFAWGEACLTRLGSIRSKIAKESLPFVYSPFVTV